MEDLWGEDGKSGVMVCVGYITLRIRIDVGNPSELLGFFPSLRITIFKSRAAGKCQPRED
jgi:hypothetical protein